MSQSMALYFYYNFYIIVGLFFQFVLLYLIYNKSPASLKKLTYYMYNTSFLQINGIICTYFLQHRILQSSTTLAILATGPCYSLGPNVCFCAYHIFLGISLCIGLSISNTVAYRYLVLVQNEMTRTMIFLRISYIYIPSLIAIVIPFTSQWNFEIVENVSKEEHPNYPLEDYQPFSGFSNINSIQFTSATVLLSIGAYFIPLCSALLTIKIVKLINAHKSMSAKTKKQSKLLVKGLAVQTLLPLICYIPLPTAYIIAQLGNIDLTDLTTSLTLLLSFPSFIDPFISFYFVVPYRKAIVLILIPAKKKTINVKIASQLSGN
ncbi:unnamed protein product [Caenorhabditis angaria]|uniref:G-protein coupled receptors family 1 profile domain-containing protein n=1 Tax=Caenorhabditis angaria TaxID=860376 RepID=A0A9P1IDS3_9PELO|nr:unnamed protein product [Caenorhabditis angaria]